MMLLICTVLVLNAFLKKSNSVYAIKTCNKYAQSASIYLSMYGYICIGFIEYMLAGRALIDYTHLLLPHDFKKKSCGKLFKIILNETKNHNKIVMLAKIK